MKNIHLRDSSVSLGRKLHQRATSTAKIVTTDETPFGKIEEGSLTAVTFEVGVRARVLIS